MANVYSIGQQVRFSAVFKNSSGVATDPTTVLFKYRAPAGTVTTLTYGSDGALVKDSTGNYHVDLALASATEWWYRWEGSGALVAADEERVLVEGTQVV